MFSEQLIEQIVEDLNFSETTLSEDVSKQPALYFYYAMRWLEVNKKLLIEKMDLDVFVAREKKRLREVLQREGKKVTEGAVEEEVFSSKEYAERLTRLNAVKVEEAFWQIVKEAFKQRKDMLEAMVNTVMVLGKNGGEVVSSRSASVDAIRESLRKKLKQKILSKIEMDE